MFRWIFILLCFRAKNGKYLEEWDEEEETFWFNTNNLGRAQAGLCQAPAAVTSQEFPVGRGSSFVLALYSVRVLCMCVCMWWWGICIRIITYIILPLHATEKETEPQNSGMNRCLGNASKLKWLDQSYRITVGCHWDKAPWLFTLAVMESIRR